MQHNTIGLQFIGSNHVIYDIKYKICSGTKINKILGMALCCDGSLHTIVQLAISLLTDGLQSTPVTPLRKRGAATSNAFGLAISRSRVQILLEATLRNNLRQVVYTYVPLSPSSITWYRPKGLQADCLYTGISSGPSARYRVWEAFTFTFTL